jgi:CRISPR-associated endoribonuclease Cas6
MRFKIHLALSNPEQNMMPLNYQYEVSSWIHKTIHFGNKKFSDWLYQQHYIYGNKKFRMFSFSNLIIPQYKIIDDRLFVNSGKIYLIITLQIEEAIEGLIIGLFRNQKFSLGDQKSFVNFEVRYVEKLDEPEFSNCMAFKTLSPMVVTKLEENTENSRTFYLAPDDPEYEKLILANLSRKHLALIEHLKSKQEQALFSHSGKTKFEILGNTRSRFIKFKTGTPEETTIRGYLFEFRLTAPVDLIKAGYNAGFGEKNSHGFGCVVVLKNESNSP